MPKKLSEKNLILGLFCFATGVLILINTTVFASPIRVSEKGMLLSITSCVLIALSIRLLRRAVIKV